MDIRTTSRSGVDVIARPALIIGEGVRKQSVTQVQAMEDAGAVKP